MAIKPSVEALKED
jgi:hypothetical protein